MKRAGLLWVLALLMAAAPAGAEAPGLRAVIDCGTLAGSGDVLILYGDTILGRVRVVCGA